MKNILLIVLCTTVLLGACSPKITTNITKSYKPLDYQKDVKVYALQDPIPEKMEELGTVKIGDTGFSNNCGYEVVVNAAKIEARKAGGNAIKIIDHIPPSFFGSSCHQIVAKILNVTDFNSLSTTSKKDSILSNADYALLHVYRFGGVGALVGYDLHLGDTVICRVKNNWKKTIRIKKDGLNTIWARTEVKEEIPVNIKIGHEYYIRCGITMGAFVGHPKIELVNNELGRAEFQSIRLSKSEPNATLVLTDGRNIECNIIKEDKDNIYFTIFKNNKEVNTQISKQQIKEIHKTEDNE